MNSTKKSDQVKKQLIEKALRKKIRSIIKEAGYSVPQGSWEEFGSYDKSKNAEDEKRKAGVRGEKDEQAQTIIKMLKDDFDIDMSSSQFQSFDKATKLRWFASAWLANKEPMFIENLAAAFVEQLEEELSEAGELDDDMIEELKEFEQLIIKHPGESSSFSEYVQSEVTGAINSMSPQQFKDFMDLANSAFISIPGGIMKYSGGEENPDDVKTWFNRRQSSKRFTGGGDPATGGGNAEQRFSTPRKM